jgi:hypothetical protein
MCTVVNTKVRYVIRICFLRKIILHTVQYGAYLIVHAQVGGPGVKNIPLRLLTVYSTIVIVPTLYMIMTISIDEDSSD